MIQFVSGDILLAETEAVAHGVAPMDDFKKGLAASLRENWPALYKDFRHFCKQTHPKPGEVWAWKGPGSYIVYNLFTQEAPPSAGQTPGKATLANVNHALKNLAREIEKENLKSVSITRLATGVGGLAWEDVRPIIDKQLGGLDADIFVYEYYEIGKKPEAI